MDVWAPFANVWKFILFVWVFMKNFFVNFLVLLIVFLILGSIFLRFQVRSQYNLKAEAVLLEEKVALLHDVVARRKLFQEEALRLTENNREQIEDVKNKIQVLDEDLERIAAETEKNIQDSPSLIARLSVLPKYAELIYAMGRRDRAREILAESEEQIREIDDTKVRASVSICFAEAALHCRNYGGYESCRKVAEELVENSDDSKWKGEMKNTLANLKMLEEEIRSIQPKAWLSLSETFPSDWSASERNSENELKRQKSATMDNAENTSREQSAGGVVTLEKERSKETDEVENQNFAAKQNSWNERENGNQERRASFSENPGEMEKDIREN